MDPASEAVDPATNETTPDAPAERKVARLWVDGRLITGEAEVAAALQSVRARTKKSAGEAPGEPAAEARKRSPEASAPRAVDPAAGVVDPEALGRVAGKLVNQLRVQEAIQIYQSILGVESNHAEANAGLGWCYLYLHDFDPSLRYFQASLEVRPDFARALYGAAMALIELGRPVEAVSYAHRLAEVPGSEHRARGLYVLGLIDRAQGAWSEAAAHLEESLQAHPHRRGGRPGWSELRHRYELAICYRELNRPDRAEEHLLWAAQHERKPGPIALELGKLYLGLERYDDAQSRFLGVLKHDQHSRTALIGLGRARLGRRDYAAALKSFTEAHSKAHDDVDALNGMAECQKRLGNLDRAADYLDQAQQLYGAQRAPLEERVRSLETERQAREAELVKLRGLAARNAMPAGVADELRQALELIRSAAQSARRDQESGAAASLSAALEDIDKGVARLDQIVGVLPEAATEEASGGEAAGSQEASGGEVAGSQEASGGEAAGSQEASGGEAAGSQEATNAVAVPPEATDAQD